MHDQLVLLVVGGLIGGGFTLAAQVINSFVAYKTATDRRRAEWLRRHLIQANEDIAALYGLEKRYVAELAKLDPSRTAESWRLGIRKEQREEDHLSPSSKATDTYATAQAHELRELHIP